MAREQQETETSSSRHRVTVVSAERELDFTSAPALEQALTAGLDDTPFVVVDLAGTRFMDSSGINAILRAHRQVAAAGGWIRISGADEPVLSTIHIVGLNEVIPLYPTVERACEDD
jgi:anti-anti-sigma factor